MRNRDKPVRSYAGVNDGLTKREKAAIAAMQGLLAASGGSEHYFGANDTRGVSQTAIAHADALFDEMEKDDDKE